MKINTLLVTWNRKEYLERSLECYLRKNGMVPHTFVIADNGSTDGTKEYLQSQEEFIKSNYPNVSVKIRYYKKNFGKFRVLNHFFRLSDPDCEYLGVMCDDVLTSRSWINFMPTVLDIFPEIGILGANDAGREWGKPEERSGAGVFMGDCFCFCDDCYVLRKKIIQELERLDRQTLDGSIHSGYILGNVWGMSENYFYLDIRKLGYETAVTKDVFKYNFSGRVGIDKEKRHNILVRRFFLKNNVKYQEATGDLMEWVENGKECSFPDEPEEEIRCKNLVDTSKIPVCTLDRDSDMAEYSKLFTPEELKHWTK